MKPHRPPEELKPERIQGRMLAIGRSFADKLSAAWKWIVDTVRRLKNVFTHSDRDQS